MRKLFLALLATAGANQAAAEPALPSIEEAANRAAIQDQVGNRCPKVEVDYATRLVLVAQFKSRDPQRWAAGYAAATKDLVSMFGTDDDAALICKEAINLYGRNGSSVPKLVKETKE